MCDGDGRWWSYNEIAKSKLNIHTNLSTICPACPQDPQELESQLGALAEAATVVARGVAQLPSVGASVAQCMTAGGGLQEVVAAGVVRGEEDAAES